MKSSGFTNGSDIEAALRGELEKTLRVELEKAVHAELEKTLRVELGKALTAQRDKILHAEREKLLRVEKEKALGLEREKALELEREKALGLEREKALEFEREKAREAERRTRELERARVAAAPPELTIKWFLGNAPAAMWVGLLALMVGVFVAGTFVGRTRFVKQLSFDHAPNGQSAVAHPSVARND